MAIQPRGMTLIELLVTMIIAGILAYAVGMIIVATATENARSFRQATLQDDVRLFERRLGKQFRSAVNDVGSASIFGGGPTGNTLQFVSYTPAGLIANDYWQYEYKVQNGNLLCDMRPRERHPVTNNLQNDAGRPAQLNQVVMTGMGSVSFSWTTGAQDTVRVVLRQNTTLAGNKSYVQESSFNVLSRNRMP